MLLEAKLTKPTSRANYLLLILSLVGVLLVLVNTSRYGAGVWPDQAVYVSAARSLLSGRGYFQYDGSPFVQWPPLFPTLLASISFGGFDPLNAARCVNAVSFGLIIFVSGLWLLKNIKSLSFVLLGSVAILLSTPLIKVSMFAGTEPLFVFLVLLFLLFIAEYLKSNETLSFVLAAVFAALACLTRYIGVTVILTGFVLLLFGQNKTFVRKLRNATMFGLISVLPITAWVVRNYMVSSTLIGERGLSPYTLAQNLNSVLDIMSVWVLFSRIPSSSRILIITLFFISMVGILAIVIRRNRNRERSVNLSQIVPVLCFLLIYTSYLVVSATIVAFDKIEDRLLSPVYVLLMLLILFAIDSIGRFPDKYFSKQVLTVLLIIGFGLWLARPILPVVQTVRHSIRNGAGGFSTTAWQNSGLIGYLKEHSPDGRAYSNAPAGVYILTGISARESPRKYLYNSPRSTMDDLLEFRRSLDSNRSTYIIWFNDVHKPYLYNLQELCSMLSMKVIATTSDGVVCLVR